MASSILDSSNFHVTKPLVEPPGDSILVEAALTPPSVDSETVEGSKDGVDNDAHLPLSKDSDLKKVMDTDTSSISPSSRLGAWAQPLKFINPSSLMNSSLESNGEEVARDHWPSLPSQNSGRMGRKVPATMSNKFVAHGLPKPLDRKEDDLRFPWAAKMNPASRNLYRATEPEYLEDGTPKVTIPSYVLLQGLQNQKEYILGQFYRCSPPPGGLIYAVFNKLWGRNCRITIRKLGESNYLFHIPDEASRTWVLQRGMRHIDDCLMVVAPWTPEATLAIPEIKTIPIWVTLKKIPNILYSIPGISHIASGLGAPMATHKPRLDPIHMGEAKILVEVELSKAFPARIAATDTTGFISMVDVEYAWLPTSCSRCGQLGHKVKRCLQSDNDEVKNGFEKESIAPISDQSLAKQSLALVHVTASNIEDVHTPSASVDNNSDPIESSIPSGMEVSPSNTLPADPVNPNEDDLHSLATISILENMCMSPTVICINEPMESPILESAQKLSSVTTHIANTISTVQRNGSRTAEPDFGSNKFALLFCAEEEEDSSDVEEDPDSMDLMTPPGKRILRERPVKPSTKAKEMHWHSTSRGRGNRGRGNRGGRG